MDACGLPRKVTRCPGFQKLISCEDEFRDQMKELEDKDHRRTEIKIEAHCKACRANQIIQVMDVSTYVVVEVPRKITQVVTKVAMTKQHEPSKIVGEDFPVDILWLFESGLEGSPHSLHKAKPEDETMLWDVVQVKYQMPHAGVWDT